MTANIKMVSVTELLQKIVKTVDWYFVSDGPSEWIRLMVTKLCDEQTPSILRSIEEHGFTDPICITVLSEDRWELGNGHHRISLAILLGLDEIPVDFSNWYSPASTSNSLINSKGIKDGDKELAYWISAMVEGTLIGAYS